MSAAALDPWEDDPRPAGDAERGELRLDLGAYEGPIDVLLALARAQKVDLASISILQLADQYLEFVAQAKRIKLELAAEYLVMAAWLAYLKSRLLLPDAPSEDDEPTGEELAQRLALQLRRLEAIRRCAELLMARPLLGRDVFARGAPEEVEVSHTVVYDLSLYQLLRIYADHERRVHAAPYRIEATVLHSVEEAIERLSRVLGRLPAWTTLVSFLPSTRGGGEGEAATHPLTSRSALASTLIAGLELAKQGKVALRQDSLFGPIFVRSLPGQEHGNAGEAGAANAASDTAPDHSAAPPAGQRKGGGSPPATG